jgi:hypothetical protein
LYIKIKAEQKIRLKTLEKSKIKKGKASESTASF